MNTPVLSRRDFLKNAGLAGGLLILPSGFLRGANAPSNRINVACVGVGGQGAGDSTAIARCGTKVIGICDVDSRRLQAAHKRSFKDAKAFADYREMFDKLGKDIDAVSVTIPDHMHFSVAYAAVQLGKHVYVQKPLTHTVDQTRRLAKLAAEKGIVSQMGNQGNSRPQIRTLREWYEAGLFGEVTEVLAWTNRPVWPQGKDAYNPEKPTPKNLNWDLWLGCSEKIPYRDGLHSFAWRGYYAFGCGALGDMAAHVLNPANYILGLGLPTKIEVKVSGKSPVAFPNSSSITFYFPKTDRRGPIKLTWLDGVPRDKQPPEARGLNDGSGSYFKASDFSFGTGENGDRIVTFPSEKQKQFLDKKVPQKYARVPDANHYRNWVDAIRNGKKAVSDFAYSGPFSEVMLLGVIAQRLGRSLEWDPAKGEFINDAEANRLVKAPPAREGFLS
ncbi:MAG: Gfo/Idh/MocA family oxidoreductase [Puniceicoccales bacterium]|nr:Gfo/Idh/MocA family oxidoreductase [Puniceicoccales bacterium]